MNDNEDSLCWDCNGTLKRVCITETYDEPVLGSITIKDIPILRCKSCGSEAIGDEGNTVVEEYIQKEYKKKGLERKYRRI